MAYDILARDGRPIKKDGDPVKAMDVTIDKIEQLDDSNKSFIATASTEDEDRDKDIIRQSGWKLKNFKKNPMIPWSHDYWGVPVARSLKTWIDKKSKKLLFNPQFDSDDEQSMKIFNKYKNGFLTSFSVGFRGIKFEYRDEEDRWWGGIEFLEQELLEISAVTIPANPNATVSLNGGDTIQNLLQLGYSQQFAETKKGLFYPVREMGEFVNPEIKAIEDNKDIQAVYANAISDMKEDGTYTEDPIAVGYYFDPQWETAAIKDWIKENNESTYKHYFYEWRSEVDDKDFEVEEIEEEIKIPDFDEPVKDKLITSSDVPDDDVDKDVDGDLSDIEKTLEEYLVKINETLDKHLEAISDGVTSAIEKFHESLLEIKSLLNEKTVASDLDLNNNRNDDDLDNPDDDKSNSKSDDDIEIDDSLLSPDNDKNNDDDIIELDDDLLSDTDTTKTVVKSVFSKKLKETLDDVRDSFKIEV